MLHDGFWPCMIGVVKMIFDRDCWRSTSISQVTSLSSTSTSTSRREQHEQASGVSVIFSMASVALSIFSFTNFAIAAAYGLKRFPLVCNTMAAPGADKPQTLIQRMIRH